MIFVARLLGLPEAEAWSVRKQKFYPSSNLQQVPIHLTLSCSHIIRWHIIEFQKVLDCLQNWDCKHPIIRMKQLIKGITAAFAIPSCNHNLQNFLQIVWSQICTLEVGFWPLHLQMQRNPNYGQKETHTTKNTSREFFHNHPRRPSEHSFTTTSYPRGKY